MAYNSQAHAVELHERLLDLNTELGHLLDKSVSPNVSPDAKLIALAIRELGIRLEIALREE